MSGFPRRGWGDIALAVVVIAVVGMMVVPLPRLAIDLLLAVSITSAVLILLGAVYAPSPARLSTLPTVILVATLFLAGVFGIYAYAIDRGYSVELARTLAMNTLVVMEIFHLFFIRNIYGTSLTWSAVRVTRVVWMTEIAVTLAQFAMTYLPPLQRVFATEPVSLRDGLLIVGVGVALFAVIETEKQVRLRARATTAQ